MHNTGLHLLSAEPEMAFSCDSLCSRFITISSSLSRYDFSEYLPSNPALHRNSCNASGSFHLPWSMAAAQASCSPTQPPCVPFRFLLLDCSLINDQLQRPLFEFTLINRASQRSRSRLKMDDSERFQYAPLVGDEIRLLRLRYTPPDGDGVGQTPLSYSYCPCLK